MSLFYYTPYDNTLTIGILDQTTIIETLKERMEEIDFLIYYFTGTQSSKQKKHKMGKKVFKEEREQDKIDDKLKYDRIVKKVPKSLRNYIKVWHNFKLFIFECFNTIYIASHNPVYEGK